MKVPKYNKIDFDCSYIHLRNLHDFYATSLKYYPEMLEDKRITAIIQSLEVAIAALDYCSKELVLIEVIEHHTFAKPDDVSDLDFPSVSSEDK